MSSTAAESLTRSRADQARIEMRHASALRLWLGTLALLIVAMILIGGATRLTDSGLSITEWKPVTGAIPPLSDSAWQEAFDAYQKIPEYLELKRGMSLDEFKTIYWWEWGHRFLGRLIGVAFLVPFLAFWFAGYIPRALLPRLLGLFVLGGLQGALGWYMVKSGLVARVDVSQYRLTAHLGVAVAILGYTLWLVFDLGRRARERHAIGLTRGVLGRRRGARADLSPDPGGRSRRRDRRRVRLQHLAADQRRLRAERPRRSLPLVSQPVREPAHRAVRSPHAGLCRGARHHSAIGLARARREAPELITSGFILMCLALLQATIGVWTLLLGVPIGLGLAHQAGAMVLFAAALYHLWLSLRERLQRGCSRRSERLIEIGDDVVDVLKPDRQPHHVWSSAGTQPRLVGELPMRGRGGMNDQASRIADIGEMAEQLDVAHERDARRHSRP